MRVKIPESIKKAKKIDINFILFMQYVSLQNAKVQN